MSQHNQTNTRRNPLLISLGVAVAVLTAPEVARADTTVQATLASYNEVPAVSSTASGSFRAKIDEAAQTIAWQLSYDGLEADALQSHMHLGQHGVNGGISVFLCTNLGNGPAGTQACPARSGELSGVIAAADVIGPGGQGISAGEFEELVAAMRAGVVYVNVHSATWPGGEIRGQIK